MLISISLGPPARGSDPKHQKVKKIPPKEQKKEKLDLSKFSFLDLYQSLSNRSPDFPFHHRTGHPKLPRGGRCLPKRPAGRSGPRRSSMCCRAFLALQPARAEIGGTGWVKIPSVMGSGFCVIYLCHRKKFRSQTSDNMDR